ncbi:TnsD family Tn7-like transposition protein [Clostridium ljungdahlii]|uniref:Transposon Tn7 transposition protein TnsD C-termianl domain-containing protein n=1 Tax=Clostridium ljungdahlii TaxID=1538 RepID=A0A162KPH4_9CLOT|nr:TnsD family Tn7-like transposition protein [Clostridium ljungdahlii]OAA85082.1 hypothetical protein WY13_02567 [Clostridium ljungdahlii]
MINVFPKMYNDELLYSVIARYRRMCGLINKGAVIEDFYGRRQGMFQMLFPLHLNKLSSMIPLGNKITGEKLLLEHTMYPFYTKFLSEQISYSIKDSMLNKTNVSIMVKTCLNSRNVSVNKYLKYCPICVAEDKKTLGESYWRREHQFTGVFFCSKHMVQLQESKVMMRKINNQYVCPDDIKITNVSSINEEYKKYNLKYISLVKELIGADEKRLELFDINRFYRFKLYEIGLATKCGIIYNKKLFDRFSKFYPRGYLYLLKSSLGDDAENSWLCKFFSNKHNKSIVKHLLLLQFLRSSISEMFDKAENVEFKKSNYKKQIQVSKLDLNERKKEWMKIIHDNPDSLRCELRNINKAVYSYIYKYDRDWYHEVTPKNVKRNKGASIDWNKRDAEFLEKVKAAVNNIKNRSGKPVRISVGSIKRETGIEKKLDNIKLVKTRKYIETVVESKEEYLIRKIEWGITEILGNGETISKNKIRKKCVLNCYRTGKTKKFINDVIDTELDNINGISKPIEKNLYVSESLL